MSTWLVTGASGFVGGALAARLLKRGDRVVTILRDGDVPLGCDVIRGSITDRDVVRRALSRCGPHEPGKFEGVFHLAAHAKVGECELDKLGAWESNVRGTYALLEELTACPRLRTVVATSDHAYGAHRLGDRPSGEDDPFVPARNVYDVSKSCADLIATCYAEHGHAVTTVRCGNIYGPGDEDLSRLVPSLVDDLVSGRTLTVRSNGMPVREFLYVEDAVDGYLAAMEHGWEGRGAFNVGAGAMSVIEMAAEVERVGVRMGFSHRQIDVLGERRGDIDQIRLDTTKARTHLGWQPRTPVAAGLWDTITWWKERKGC